MAVYSKPGKKLLEQWPQIERRTTRSIAQNRRDCKRLRISLPDGNPRRSFPLRAPLTGLAFLAFEAGWSPLALSPGRSSRTALGLVARLLPSSELNFKFAKTLVNAGTALNIIKPTLKITTLYLFFGQKFGEKAFQKLSLRFPLGDDVFLDDGGEPAVAWDRLLCGLARPPPIRVRADRIKEGPANYRLLVAAG
jgi:hypothetical protein